MDAAELTDKTGCMFWRGAWAIGAAGGLVILGGLLYGVHLLQG